MIYRRPGQRAAQWSSSARRPPRRSPTAPGWKVHPRPPAGSSRPRRCFPAPALRGGSRDSPPPPARAEAGPAAPAGTQGPLPRRSGAHRTGRPGTLRGSPPAPAAAQGRPARRRGSAARATNTAVPFAAAPTSGRGTAPGPHPGWRGHSGWAAVSVQPQPSAARRARRSRAEPDTPVHKSRSAPAPPDSPLPPASDRPRPPCSPRQKALPPDAACRASASPPGQLPSASRRRGCGRAAHKAAHRMPRPVLSSNGP